VDVEITGRHVDVTQVMRDHISQHVAKLPRFDGNIQYITVTLALDSGAQFVEIIAKCHRADLVAQSKGHDMYRCIEEAFARMQRQIIRHHDKVTSHKPKAAQ